MAQLGIGVASLKLIHVFLLAAGAAHSQIAVGTARVDITPDTSVALAGYPDPEQRMSAGIHDRLYARAIAFKTASRRLVLVSTDLSGFQMIPVSFFRKDILAKFNLEPAELFLCGTHTHSAPVVMLNPTYPHPNNFQYTEVLKGKLLEAVGKALNSVTPARLAIGVGHSPIAVNRRLPIPADKVSPGGSLVTMGRNPEGPVDREVQVLRIVRPNGAPLAALFDYGCHSRSLRAANKLISGDIFGIAEQFVEKILGPGVVSPAFAGASGDVDPWYVVPGFSEEPGWIPETVLMGTMLGEEVVRVFRGATDLAPGAEIRTRQEQLALPGKTAGAAKSVEMTAASIGEVALLGVDCEALVEIGKEIKARSPFQYTFILTNCNGGSGYLPPAHLYKERGYEVDLTGFAPEAAALVVQNAVKMLTTLR